MKAPEKIYLEKVYPDNGTLPNGLNYNQSPNDIEYIRTDAFIEKAMQWINNNLAKYSELTDVDEYGNKLNETVMNVFYGQAVKDFQAYMKG